MGRGKPVELATRSFATQIAAIAFFQKMLHGYQPGDRVKDDDAIELSALLELHTEYKEKVGVGVDHFEVMKVPPPESTNCFRVVRTDGSGTDFSYRHCIRQRPSSQKQEVSHAFRRVVQPDLWRAREVFFKAHVGSDGLVACAVTKERLALDDGQMDHRPPMTFEVIVTTFLASRGMSVDDVPLTTYQDEQAAPDITAPAIREEFRAFHKQMAKMDFVKRKVNLAQSSQNRIKSTRISL